jgi:cobalt-zinc-cadmium efflux system protein
MTEHTHGSHLLVSSNQRRLLIALSITALMTAVELAGGLISNSLALIGDAGHMFTDTLALGLSFYALNLAKRPATQTKTYGYYRAEILAALTNGVILILVSGYIFYEAYQRIVAPPEVHGGLMVIVAAVGLVANVMGISVLRFGKTRNLNVKGAFLHMLSDTLSSIGVIAAGAIILLTGRTIADPIISIVIGILILRGAGGLVSESVNILLEAVPKHLDVSKISDAIRGVKGVKDVHDMHLWAITSDIYAISCHLLIEDQMVSNCTQIVDDVNQMLSHKFGISHSTVQLECEECENSPVCHIGGEHEV